MFREVPAGTLRARREQRERENNRAKENARTYQRETGINQKNEVDRLMAMFASL